MRLRSLPVFVLLCLGEGVPLFAEHLAYLWDGRVGIGLDDGRSPLLGKDHERRHRALGPAKGATGRRRWTRATDPLSRRRPDSKIQK